MYAIPYVIEQTSNGEKAYDIYSRLLKDNLNNLLSKHTGQDVKTIEKDTERDNYKSATEACEYGLVDEVITKIK